MITKKLYVTPDNGYVIPNYPTQNAITFCANLPVQNGEITNVVTAVKHNGAYLQDMDGAVVNYHREKMDGNYRCVATVVFPDGIPENYKAKLDSYQLEDFIVEYHEEVIID